MRLQVVAAAEVEESVAAVMHLLKICKAASGRQATPSGLADKAFEMIHLAHAGCHNVELASISSASLSKNCL